MFKKIKISDNTKEKIKFVGIIIILSLFVCIPYLNEGTIFAHDLTYHLSRIMNTAEEITNGNFPVFIHSNLLNGFGYGNSLFYPELFLYPAIILFKLGFGILFSYKMLIVFATIFTFLTSFYAAKFISKDKKIAWITSMLYSMSLYRLVDIYVRGALGEVLAFIFLPLVLVGLYDVLYGDNKKWYLISLSLFAIMNSHLLSFIMTVLLILGICALHVKTIFKNKDRLKTLLIAAVIAVCLCMSFILPYFEQTIAHDFNVEVHKNSVESLKENATELQEVFRNEFVSDGLTVTKSLGILIIVLPILMFFVKDKNKEYSFYYKMFILGIITLVISTKVFPWKYFGFLSIIQFPYRLNLITTLLLSFVSGYVVINVFNNKEDIFKLVIIVILMMSASYISKVNVNPFIITYEVLMSGNKIGNGEYIPVGFDANDKDVYSIYEFDNKIEYTREKDKLIFNYEKKDNEFKVHVPLAFYKGYVAYVQDEEGNKVKDIDVQRNELNSHLLLLSDSSTEGKIVVEYKTTTIQKIGYIFTIMTLVVFVNYIIYVEKIEKEEKVR